MKTLCLKWALTGQSDSVAPMANEIDWERTAYESRVDAMAGEVSTFVTAVLGTIDVEAAKASPERWELVCRFFAGCGRAARAQGNTPDGGGKRIAAYLAAAFPCNAEGSNDGFFEFMDWLSNPAEFRPVVLDAALKAIRSDQA